MGTSSTNVENPVNQIASLLAGDAEQPKEETQEAVTTEETQDEEIDESQSQESEDESLAQDEEESAESSDKEGEIDTLNNLAEELDTDVSDLYALNVNLSRGENLPDGGSITLGELKTFYEQNADIDSVRHELTEREQTLESERNELKTVPQVSNELLQARAHVLAIQDSYNRTNWQQLRADAPAEYAALQSDFRAQFELAKANEQTAMQTVEAQTTEKRMQQQQRLFEAKPELKDDKVRAQIAADVQQFTGKYGFTPNELEMVEDARLMRLLIDATQANNAKAQAKEKQEKKPPTSHKAAARKPLPGRKAALKRLTEKARKSNDIRDKADAVHALLNG